MKTEEVKKLVTKKYAEIAGQNDSCCASSCGCNDDIDLIGDQYSKLEGYAPEADLGLGCGLPTEYANIKEGDVVVDLGSGAGNDCFVARSLTGAYGKIIGVDFTPEMIEKARDNAVTLGFKNIHFIQGDIEEIPLEDDLADVVISNCVLNLVPDKQSAFKEMFRIIKPGGHFSISDVVIKGTLPDSIKQSAELYVGCVSGAISKADYLDTLKNQGFSNIKIQKESKISIPSEVLNNLLEPNEAEAFRNGESGVYSITIYGEKPSDCCDSECCN